MGRGGDAVIPEPCSRLWEEFPGDDRRRFCGACGRDVHAVAAYSDGEWADLLKKERVCAYWAGEGAAAPRSRRAIVAGAFLTTISPLLAQTGGLLVSVRDASDAPVPSAEVILLCADKQERRGRADGQGIVRFTDLPLGDANIRVTSPGFVIWRGVQRVGSGEGRVAVSLQIGEITMGVFVSEPKRRWWRWRR